MMVKDGWMGINKRMMSIVIVCSCACHFWILGGARLVFDISSRYQGLLYKRSKTEEGTRIRVSFRAEA